MLFAGEWQDPTGLIYLRARYYDPATGRFLSRDPYPGGLDDPSSLHPYAYCGNNPVLYVDPSGELVICFLAVPFVASEAAAVAALGTAAVVATAELVKEISIAYAKKKAADEREAKELIREGQEILGRTHDPTRAKRWQEWYDRLSKREKKLYREYNGPRPRKRT